MPNYSCKTCGVPLDGNASNCPRCMLQMGVEEPTIAADLHRFDLPTPDQLDRAIPRLEVMDLIAHGGMGAVYRARQRDLDRIVAVKVLPAELSKNRLFVERFAQEAKTLASLNHANIVIVHDSGIAEGWCYIVMEYVDGVTLRDAIVSGRVTSEQSLGIVPDLCDALKTAHQQGIVHRDIKPENILLTKDGVAKIADFGIAKLLGANNQDSFNAGTRRYMAPEQLDGNEDVDHRADIYSLGVVFYELLTGQTPGSDFVPPSESAAIDQRIDLVVKKTLERRPEYRYQDVREIAEELERLRSKEQSAPSRAQLLAAMNPGVDWRTKATIFGYPVIHMASGIDPKTGRKRIAKGWIAIGDIAIGAIAVGGVGIGVVGIGGCGIGLIAFGGAAIAVLLGMGGLATGLFADGGMAIGGIAHGGGAAGGIAVGGGATGYVAIGGAANGKYTISGRGVSPPGWLDTNLGSFVTDQLPGLMVSIPIGIYLAILIPLLVTAVLKLLRFKKQHLENEPSRSIKEMPKGLLIGGVVALVGSLVAVVVMSVKSTMMLNQIIKMVI